MSPHAPQGGARPGAGRKRCDSAHRSIRLNCSLPPPVWEELTKREAKTGVYRSQIVRAILIESLLGGTVPPSRGPEIRP